MPGKVFGVDLETLVAQQKVEMPKIVVHVLEYLHAKKAHLEEGLFRIPGNSQRIVQLKKQFDTDGHVDLFKQKDLEVHTIAGILKLFLRELPVPVIIPRYYSTFLKVYLNQDARQRMMNFRKLIVGLPKANRLLLLSILSYLHVVAQDSIVNKMSTLNLALIFAPNIMKAEKETPTQIWEDSDKVAGSLQILIQEVEYLKTGIEPAWFSDFVKTLPRSKSFSSPPVPKKSAFQDNSESKCDSMSSSPISDSECSTASTSSFDSISIQIDVFCTSLPNPDLESYAPRSPNRTPEVPKRRSVNRSLSFSPQSELVDPNFPDIQEEEEDTHTQALGISTEIALMVANEPSDSFSSPPDSSLFLDLKAVLPDPQEISNLADFNNKKLLRHSTVVLPSYQEPPSPRSKRTEPLVRARSETALVTSLASRRHGPAMTKEECKYKFQRLAQMSERIARNQQLAMMSLHDTTKDVDSPIENV